MWRFFGGQRPDLAAPCFAEIYRIMKQDTFCVSFYGWPHAVNRMAQEILFPLPRN